MKRNVRTISLILMAASLSAADVQAQLTVEQAVQMALENNSLIIGADATVIDARSGLYRSYSGILPSLRLEATRSASVREQLRGTQSFSGLIFPTDRQDFTGYTNSPTLSGSWTFLDMAALSDWSSAKSGMKAANLAHKATRQEVALDARVKFYDVVRAIHLSRVSNEALRFSRDDERRVRALFNVGSVSRSDLLRAQVRTAQSELDSITRGNAIGVSRIALATAIGVEEQQMGAVDTVLTASPRSYDEPQVLAEAEKARPDIQSAKAEWDAARASVRAANYLRLPSLFVTGSATVRPVSTSKTTLYEDTGVPLDPPTEANTRSDVDRIYGGAIGLSWNIFTGFGNEAAIASSKARVLRAQNTHDVLKRNLQAEVHQTLLTYREVVEASNVAQRAIESAEENMKLTQQKYNVGSATILDLIDAQVQLQRAQSDGILALAGIRVAEARVDKVRGGGD